MENNLIKNFRCLIKSINWYIGGRKLEFSNEKFTLWQNRYKSDYDSIKESIEDFSAETLIKNLRLYFNYLDENNIDLDKGDLQFLTNFEDSESFMQDEVFEKIRDKKVRSIPDTNISRLAEQVGKVNINVSLNIDKLDGTEEDLEDWFDAFERISSSNAWTNDIKALKLPCYLKETALLIWQSLSAHDKIDYDECKAVILKRLGTDESFEQIFFERRQKDSESVTVFSLKLSKLARKAFNNADKDKEILKVFWKGLKPCIKKLVLAVEPSSLAHAVDTARKAENYYAEQEKEIKIDIVEDTPHVSALKSQRPFRSKEQKENVSRFSSGSSSDNSGSRNHKRHDLKNNSKSSFRYERSKSPKKKLRCFNCGNNGHFARDCTQYSKQSSRTCFKCNKPGHIASKCYSKNF